MSAKSRANSFERKKVLKDGIERLSRLLEAENASSRSVLEAAAFDANENVGTGLGALFHEEKSISPEAVRAYHDFSKGVWSGFDGLDGNCWVVAGFEPANRGAGDGEDFAPSAPKLSIHPVVTGPKLPSWVTLECEVDKASIKENASLTLNLVADFLFPESRQAAHTNTVRASLRCKSKDGTYEDVDVGYFPVTTLPMIHKVITQVDSEGSKLLASAHAVRLLLWLPSQGGYSFNLYGLSLESA